MSLSLSKHNLPFWVLSQYSNESKCQIWSQSYWTFQSCFTTLQHTLRRFKRLGVFWSANGINFTLTSVEMITIFLLMRWSGPCNTKKNSVLRTNSSVHCDPSVLFLRLKSVSHKVHYSHCPIKSKRIWGRRAFLHANSSKHGLSEVRKSLQLP